jgi:ParB-like chromosome segregation protein Spo0J
MNELQVHPLAELFPLLAGAALDELTADIAENGQRVPITLTVMGELLDGRNRLEACRRAGVEPIFERVAVVDPLALIVSLNLKRRHLTASQRAMVAAKIANLAPGRPAETAAIDAVSQTAAAEMLNVSRESVQRAAVVVEHGMPELAEAVEAGEVSVSAAAEVARLPPEQQAQVVDVEPEESLGEAIMRAAAEAKAEKKKAKKAKKDSDADPPYRPDARREAVIRIGSCALEIADKVAAVGPEFIAAGFIDQHQRRRDFVAYRRAIEALTKIMEACDGNENGSGSAAGCSGGCEKTRVAVD